MLSRGVCVKRYVFGVLAAVTVLILVTPTHYTFAVEAGDDALVADIARAVYLNRPSGSQPDLEELRAMKERVKQFQQLMREDKLSELNQIGSFIVLKWIYFYAANDAYSRLLPQLQDNAERVTDIYNRAYNENKFGLCGDAARYFMDALKSAHDTIGEVVTNIIPDNISASAKEIFDAQKDRALFEELVRRLGFDGTEVGASPEKIQQYLVHLADPGERKNTMERAKASARKSITEHQLKTELEALQRARSLLGVDGSLSGPEGNIADCIRNLKENELKKERPDMITLQRLEGLIKELNAAIAAKIEILHSSGVKTSSTSSGSGNGTIVAKANPPDDKEKQTSTLTHASILAALLENLRKKPLETTLKSGPFLIKNSEILLQIELKVRDANYILDGEFIAFFEKILEELRSELPKKVIERIEKFIEVGRRKGVDAELLEEADEIISDIKKRTYVPQASLAKITALLNLELRTGEMAHELSNIQDLKERLANQISRRGGLLTDAAINEIAQAISSELQAFQQLNALLGELAQLPHINAKLINDTQSLIAEKQRLITEFLEPVSDTVPPAPPTGGGEPPRAPTESGRGGNVPFTHDGRALTSDNFWTRVLQRLIERLLPRVTVPTSPAAPAQTWVCRIGEGVGQTFGGIRYGCSRLQPGDNPSGFRGEFSSSAACQEACLRIANALERTPSGRNGAPLE